MGLRIPKFLACGSKFGMPCSPALTRSLCCPVAGPEAFPQVPFPHSKALESAPQRQPGGTLWPSEHKFDAKNFILCAGFWFHSLSPGKRNEETFFFNLCSLALNISQTNASRELVYGPQRSQPFMCVTHQCEVLVFCFCLV